MYLGKILTATVATLVISACSSTDTSPIYQQSTKYKATNPYATGAQVRSASYQTQAAAPVTYAQPASYSRVNQECLNKEGNRKMIGTAAGGVVGAIAGRKIAGKKKKTLGTVAGAVIGGAAGYGIADKTINCDPVAVPINASTRQAPIAQPYQGAPATPASTAYTVAPTPAPQTSGGIVENTQSLGEVGTPGYYAVNGYPAPAPTTAPPMNANAGNSYPQPTPVPLQPQNIPSGFAGTQDHVIVTGDTVYSLARKSCVSVSELQSINGINDDYYIRVGESLKIPTGRCSIK